MQPIDNTIILPDDTAWETVLKDPLREKLESLLPAYLRGCRWFGGKARKIQEVRITDSPAFPSIGDTIVLLVLAVSYADGEDEHYLLPLSHGSGDDARLICRDFPSSVLTRVGTGTTEGIIYDGVYDRRFRESCFECIVRGGPASERIRGLPGEMLREWTAGAARPPESSLLGKEQSNTSFLYGDLFIFKLYRRLAAGKHPEVEMARFLTEETGFTRIAPYAGMIELHLPGAPATAIGLLQGFVEHRDDAWNYSLRAASGYLNSVSPEEEGNDYERYRRSAALLGKRTAELHLALASKPGNPDFAPEPFTSSDHGELISSIRYLIERALTTLRDSVVSGAASIRLLSHEASLFELLNGSITGRAAGKKTRIHGDYHLGQLLYTGDDFVVIDFEGEPARPVEERRRKRSPLVDVAGMIRSFHYAAYGAIFLNQRPGTVRADHLFERAERWYQTMNNIFLHAYMETMAGGADLLPANRRELRRMLNLFILEKAVYELNYELNNRPDWVIIPIRGLNNLIAYHE